jgi:uncharacterized protein YgiM (DUF1202 family)
VTLAASLWLTGCASDRDPAIGEAYVGPATLNLRQELAPKSPISATVRHGDRLDVLASRRRMIKVRTEDGKEGWVDGFQLLTSQQMTELRDLAEHALTLPRQASATVYDALNMHTEPSRQAPSFYQIPDRGQVEVVGHHVAPRGYALSVPQVLSTVQKNQPVRRKRNAKKPASNKLPPPPMPPPPALPADWLRLSSTPGQDLPEASGPVTRTNPKVPAPPPQPTEAEKANVLEDWSLVRTKDGRVGWVLSRLLVMNIPDEVAQYAEGARITSFFSLGDVRDRDREVVKQHWLWTTVKKGPPQPNAFDSLRVFIWNSRRHRWETAHLERNLRGYYPIEVTPGANATFSVVVQDDRDAFVKRTYSFTGHTVRLISKAPYEPPEDWKKLKKSVGVAVASTRPAAERGWLDRTKESVNQQWKKWFP